MVRHSLRGEHPLGFIAVVEQYGPAAGTATRFDIVEDVADKPGLLQVNAMIAGSTKDKTRRGLAAVALDVVARLRALRVVWTVVEACERHVAFSEQPVHTLLDPSQRILRKTPPCHARLVRHDDQLVARRMQQKQPLGDPFHEAHLRRVHIVWHVFQQRAVLVKKNCSHLLDVGKFEGSNVRTLLNLLTQLSNFRTFQPFLRPGCLAHGQDGDLWYYGLVRLREDELDCFGYVFGVLQITWVRVGEAVEDERRAHTTRYHRRYLDAVRAALDMQGVAEP